MTMDDISGARGGPVAPSIPDLLRRAAASEKAGRLDEAVSGCGAVLAIDASNFDAWFMLSGIAASRGDAQAALNAIDRALKQASGSAQAHCRRGSILRLLKRHEDAAKSQRRAIAIDPNYAEAHNNLGNCLRDLGDLEGALRHYRRASEAKPDYIQALNNLGVVQLDLGKDDAALESFSRALALSPNYANAHYNRGVALLKLARPAEALVPLRNAVRLSPKESTAHLQLAIAQLMLGREEEAEPNLGQAVALLDGKPEPELELSMQLLQRGQLKHGWKHYEARLRLGDVEPARPKVPQWAGEPIEGKSILVQCEQGLGDTLQFCRYVPLLAARGAKVTTLVPPALERLLRPIAGVATVKSKLRGNARFDYRSFLMSLPGLLGTALETIPQSASYLVAEPERVEHWRRILGADGFKIAICWQGNPAAKVDKGRSIPVAAFAPLAAIPGVRLISLQKRFGLDQLAHLPGGMKVEQLDGLDEGEDAFVDSAAVIKNCDLVVTSDTSIAHLAGALGAPTWVALSTGADWRWLRARGDSPWYPSLTLFRQRSPGNWSSVFAEMAKALQGKLVPEAGRQPAAESRQGPRQKPKLAEPIAPVSIAPKPVATVASVAQDSELTKPGEPVPPAGEDPGQDLGHVPKLPQPTAPISWGELFDKISILEIKSERITADPARANVLRELEALKAAAAVASRRPFLALLRRALREVNLALWEIEDEIRTKEASQAFDDRFIALARSVYQTNDRRAEIKRRINEMLGSTLIEEKHYSNRAAEP